MLSKELVFSLDELMHNYYKRASFLHATSERVIGRLLETDGDKGVSIQDAKNLEKQPILAFKAWKEAHTNKHSITDEAKEQILRASYAWDDNLRNDKAICEIFREIISDPIDLDKVLFEMYETRAIFKIFPEFIKIYHMVQYDPYHLYTVDVHTVFVIKEISKLAKGEYQGFKTYSETYEEVSRKDLLILASILHDVGKGFERDVEDHAECGARVGRKVAKELGYIEEDLDTIEFLVRSHLILPQIAFCRDIDEPQLIENLAHVVKTSDALRLLFLLTFADIRATGPEIWSSWKNELLTKLYLRTIDLLEGRGYTALHVKSEVEKKEDEIKNIIRECDRDQLVKWIHDMPVRFILNTSSKKIAAEYQVLRELDGSSSNVKMKFSESKDSSYNNLTIMTKDRPGLFAKMCSVLVSNNISIIEAQLNTGKNGDIVDYFKVVKANGMLIDKNFDWQDLERELDNLIASNENVSISIFLEKHPKKKSLRRRRKGHTTEVLVDNDVSPLFSVVEIHAPDKLGLLYMIAEWLYEHKYSIFMAKATTHIGQAIDIFYINDIYGNKIKSKGKLKEIKKGLLELLE